VDFRETLGRHLLAIETRDLDTLAGTVADPLILIMADGQLVNAPEVRYSSFAGRIQITGLSKEKTDDLFRRLDALIKS